MLVHRVFPYLASAADGEKYSPTFVPPQGVGRLDNADLYTCWYFASSPSGAVGEMFGEQREWSDGLLTVPYTGARRVLGLFALPDNLNLLDLDDAQVLVDYKLRPTQVVEPNRSMTQRWARRIATEYRPGTSVPAWDGVSWWSLQRPHWKLVAVFVRNGNANPASFVSHEPLGKNHPAVQDAMSSLKRAWV